MAVDDAYRRDAAPVIILHRSGAIIGRAECAQCGRHEEWRVYGRCPPSDQMPKHFRQKGWNLSRRVTCPDCQSAKKEPTMTKANVTPISDAKQLPTDVVRVQRQNALILLLDHFNTVTGRYSEGWSDDRVAKETGLPKAWVTGRREEDFGPLKEPPEIATMRAEVEFLNSRLIEVLQFKQRMTDVLAEWEALAKRNGWG